MEEIKKGVWYRTMKAQEILKGIKKMLKTLKNEESIIMIFLNGEWFFIT